MGFPITARFTRPTGKGAVAISACDVDGGRHDRVALVGGDHGTLVNLGLTDGAHDGTKARYAFVYGDFRRVHRTGLIACVYRASEWRHKSIELAAHDLLQHLDEVAR